MVEFSEREKTIILITTYINHPATKAVPNMILKYGLQSMLKAMSISISDNEIQDLIDGIKNQQLLSMKQGFGFLNKNKDQLGIQ